MGAYSALPAEKEVRANMKGIWSELCREVKLKRQLLLWDFHSWLGSKLRGGPDFAEYRAREATEELRQDIHTLQYQLAKARADRFDLEQKVNDSPRIFENVFAMSKDALRKKACFAVYESPDHTDWQVITQNCCLCGCDLQVHSLPSEREALLFAVLIHEAGYRMPHNLACTSCYQEGVANA